MSSNVRTVTGEAPSRSARLIREPVTSIFSISSSAPSSAENADVDT
jgi:hypothetical protein